jgi:hypothetical protein
MSRPPSDFGTLKCGGECPVARAPQKFIELPYDRIWVQLIGEDLVHDLQQGIALLLPNPAGDGECIIVAGIGNTASIFGCSGARLRFGVGSTGQQTEERR